MDDRLVSSVLVLLAATLIALKLAGVISWPWLAVLAPLWVPALFSLVLLVFVIIGIAIFTLTRRTFW